jgi:putative capsular polysaccharide synthesis protein
MRGDWGRRIVVFTMGKTGSTAIARAVSQATGERVFQVFRLDAADLAAAERRYRAANREARRAGRAASSVPFPGALHLWESEFLLRHMPTPETRWDVITTVREPVAQAVSAFFHGSRRRGVLQDGSNVAELTERMLAEHWLGMPMRWFEREFLPGLGVDVFAHPFVPAIGFALIETPAVRVLLARQENLDGAPEALRDFFRLPAAVPIARRNEAESKDYAASYRAFLRDVRLPESVLESAYATSYSRHFYAADELAEFRARWSGRRAAQ